MLAWILGPQGGVGDWSLLCKPNGALWLVVLFIVPLKRPAVSSLRGFALAIFCTWCTLLPSPSLPAQVYLPPKANAITSCSTVSSLCSNLIWFDLSFLLAPVPFWGVFLIVLISHRFIYESLYFWLTYLAQLCASIEGHVSHSFLYSLGHLLLELVHSRYFINICLIWTRGNFC